YALVPFAGDWLRSRAYQQAHNFAVPLHGVASSVHEGPLPPASALITAEPPELVLSTLKRSEDSMRLILRAWNISEGPIDAHITLPTFVRSATLAGLDEIPAPPAGGTSRLQWTAGPPPSVSLRVGAREIITLSLEV
ncbi:MAG TPA: glycosyl hydrolase-related protein, partial [Chloroflexia bacterium]|nr:glycosyl hydrolase-related protein [Chloroflexia bacterium]